MDMSLIIPTHERVNGVMALLGSITRQDLGSLEIEIIVVSNLHEEALERKIETFSKEKFEIHYCYSGTIGVNQARNTGIDRSRSDLLLFLDDDVVLSDESYLKKVFGHALSHPEAAAIGGRYCLPKKTNNSDKAYFNISNSWLTSGKRDQNLAIHLVGGNTLYNKRVLGHYLRFNENIVFGGAETELNLKIFQANLPLMLFEDIGLLHFTRLTPKKLFRKAFFQGMGRAYHEFVVRREIWSTKGISDVPTREPVVGNQWSVFWQTILINLFDLIFRIGYRQAKLTKCGPVRTSFVLKCALVETFDLDPDKMIHTTNATKDYYLALAIRSKILTLFKSFVSLIPFWRIPWFFKHILGPQLWRIPWFLKWKIFSRIYYFLYEHGSFIASRMWLIPWAYRHKFVPWWVSLFSGLWRIPWFMKWRIYIRLRAMVSHFWRIPWFVRWRILPIFPLVLSRLWVIPWVIRWKILPWFAFWKLPWWRIPWFLRHHFLNHCWRIPWFFKWRFLPSLLFVGICTFSMFFPINTIGLVTVYATAWMELERFIKRPWSID